MVIPRQPGKAYASISSSIKWGRAPLTGLLGDARALAEKGSATGTPWGVRAV